MLIQLSDGSFGVIAMQVSVFDTKGAAAYVGLAVPTLEAMRVSGRGPSYMKLGRSVRYRVADLDKWLAARVVTSTSQPVAA
jgi:excisionase family DNA binding protein